MTSTKPTLINPTDNPPTASVQPAPDPFDLASLRLNPSFIETAGVTKLLTTVPVRRPGPQDFFRVNSAPAYRENFAMIELKDDREDFLVRPELLPNLSSEVVFKTLFTAVTRLGVVLLWPVRLPAPDDRRNDWARSAREGAEIGDDPLGPHQIKSFTRRIRNYGRRKRNGRASLARFIFRGASSNWI